MTIAQWDAHKQHVDEHIMWPATKQQILDACEGMDVEKGVLEEIKTKLADGDRKYSKEELKGIMVV